MRRGRVHRLAVWVTRYEPALLVLLAPWLLLPEVFPAMALPALLVVPLLWLARRVAVGSFARRTALDWPIVGLLAALALGACIAPIPALAAPKLCAIVLGVAAYYALAGFSTTPARLRTVGGGFAVVAIAVSLAGLVGADWQQTKMLPIDWLYRALPRLVNGVPRSEAGGFHPNQVGAALACMIPVLVALLLRPSDSPSEAGKGFRAWGLRVLRGRALVWAGLAASGVVLLLTQSRTSWAAAAVSVILLAAALARRRRTRILARTALGLAAIGAVAVLVRALTADTSAGPTAFQTVGSRLEIWTAGWRAAQDYAFTGAGLASFEPVARLHYVLANIPADYPMTHAHNLVLQAVSDGGVIGLACLLWLLVAAAGLAVRGLVRSDPARRTLLAGAACGLAAWLVLNLPDCLPLGSKPGTALWLVLGLLVGSVAVPVRTGARPRPLRRRLIGIGAVGFAVALVALLPAARARLLADLGRLAENRALLSPRGVTDSTARTLARAVDLLSASLTLRPDEPRAADDLSFTRAALADPATAIRRLGLRCGAQGVDWIDVPTPARMRVNHPVDVPVTFVNCGQLTWPAHGASRAVLAYRWLRIENGSASSVDTEEGSRALLPFDVAPGQEVTAVALLYPPRNAGAYLLRWDVFIMDSGWLHDGGCTPVASPVTVVEP